MHVTRSIGQRFIVSYWTDDPNYRKVFTFSRWRGSWSLILGPFALHYYAKRR